jgi:hypothetical protein
MKKFLGFLLIILTVILCLSLMGCKQTTTITEGPLSLISETKDSYDNVLRQIYYNDTTGDYVILEYSYQLQQGKWVCIDQQTIFYQRVDCEPYPDANYCGPDLGLPYTYE